jgi:hypothetical protein
VSNADRFPAAVWCVARWLYDGAHGNLDASDPIAIFANANTEIAEAVAAMVRGDAGARKRVASLAAGAAAVRENAPRAKDWISVSSPLRAPACAAPYNAAFDWLASRHSSIRRVAHSLINDRRMSAAQALWIYNMPTTQAA